jgi:hypothetical protein
VLGKTVKNRSACQFSGEWVENLTSGEFLSQPPKTKKPSQGEPCDGFHLNLSGPRVCFSAKQKA